MSQPKGYWLARVNITDPDKYKEYVAQNGVAFAKYGGRFVVRGGQSEVRCGPEHQRLIVLEFDSYDQARACYDSEEYQRIVPIRDAGAQVDLVIVEGVA